MLLLVLLLPPLGLYLLALGWINRRPRPVMMAGIWEFAGVLFGLSGFVLFAGPAFLGSIDERSRWFWLLGQADSHKAPAGEGWAAWTLIRVGYFVLVAAAAAFMLWRCRRLTSVYNVESRSVFTAIDQALARLGIHAVRTGDAFVIGPGALGLDKDPKGEGVQAAPGAGRQAAEVQTVSSPAASPLTALHVDVFPLMRHATLRWAPAQAALRREVEQEVARTLAESQQADHESLLGGILTLLGAILFLFALFAAGFLVIYRLYPPR